MIGLTLFVGVVIANYSESKVRGQPIYVMTSHRDTHIDRITRFCFLSPIYKGYVSLCILFSVIHFLCVGKLYEVHS